MIPYPAPLPGRHLPRDFGFKMAESRVGGYADVARDTISAPVSVRRPTDLRKSQSSDISGEWSGYRAITKATTSGLCHVILREGLYELTAQ
jgi:hypothetical protein